MAKRRKLEAPSAEDLSRIETEMSGVRAPAKPAPIAQIAGQAAATLDPRTSEDREASATLAHAKEAGLLLREVSLADIDADALVRDRVALDPEELEELKVSIRQNGVRLPIELFEQSSGRRYGLVSGYRRYVALKQLADETDAEGFKRIKAIVRPRQSMGDSLAAMVEENEVRAQLSHFERGRIAVISAQQGAFQSTEAAVDALFGAASKAKRSKIRSFARIFEGLGDLLRYPDAIREKDGLRIASALRDGHDDALRDHLVKTSPENAEQERELLEEALGSLGAQKQSKGMRKGRPRNTKIVHGAGGISLSGERRGNGLVVQISGMEIQDAEIEALLVNFERVLAQGRLSE